MIDKDDCTFSAVYSLLQIKSKAYIFENILEFLSGRINHISKKCRHDTIILLFTLAIASAFAECRCELERPQKSKQLRERSHITKSHRGRVSLNCLCMIMRDGEVARFPIVGGMGGMGAPPHPILGFFSNPSQQNQCPPWGTPPTSK